MLLHQRENLDQRMRPAAEDLVAARLDEAAAQRKALVQVVWLGWLRGAQDVLFQHLQQHVVEAAERLDRAVVELHELLHRKIVILIDVAEHLRHPHLVVEQQPVLAAASGHVQGKAHPPQEILAGKQFVAFGLGQKAPVAQFGEAAGVVMPLGNPGDGVDVA